MAELVTLLQVKFQLVHNTLVLFLTHITLKKKEKKSQGRSRYNLPQLGSLSLPLMK